MYFDDEHPGEDADCVSLDGMLMTDRLRSKMKNINKTNDQQPQVMNENLTLSLRFGINPKTQFLAPAGDECFFSCERER